MAAASTSDSWASFFSRLSLMAWLGLGLGLGSGLGLGLGLGLILFSRLSLMACHD